MTEPNGLSSEVKSQIRNIISQSLKGKNSFSVYVFGSRSKNTFRQYSDLDLWIESSPPLSVRETTLLLNQFEESDLAIKLDVVTPESCLPAYFPVIEEEKKIWFRA